MATCYLCAANRAPTEEPAAIASCSNCGMFFCRWDGARHHGTAHFFCAVCLVPMLLRASGVDISDWPDLDDGGGGGGLGASYAAARAELSVKEFDEFCADMSDASQPYRLKWRAVLGELDQNTAAAAVSQRIGEFAGGSDRVEAAYRDAIAVDAEGAAAAVGVAESAARAEAMLDGELTLPGSRTRALHEEELTRKEVEQRKEELAAQARRQAQQRAEEQRRAQDEEKKKVRYRTAGG